MTQTQLGELAVSPIGFGCMALSHVYGGTSEEAARATLNAALDAGITFLDTADVYGQPRPGTNGPAGTNEEMLAPLLQQRRAEVQLATKFGISGRVPLGQSPAESVRTRDGRHEYVAKACEASLRRLGVEMIDLYYLHRPDPEVAIEETVGAMAELVQAGKVRCLGLSEVTADELRRAHAVYPITAVQSEWSLWSRDVEAQVVPICAELGIGFVPYSPLGRGFLTGKLTQEAIKDDFRSGTARMGQGWEQNQQALEVLAEVAQQVGGTNSQVALAWLFAKGAEFGVVTVPIPGSRRAERMIENLAATKLNLSSEQIAALDSLADQISGDRNIVADPKWISSGRE